jgi:hypothetical protein
MLGGRLTGLRTRTLLATPCAIVGSVFRDLGRGVFVVGVGVGVGVGDGRFPPLFKADALWAMLRPLFFTPRATCFRRTKLTLPALVAGLAAALAFFGRCAAAGVVVARCFGGGCDLAVRDELVEAALRRFVALVAAVAAAAAATPALASGSCTFRFALLTLLKSEPGDAFLSLDFGPRIPRQDAAPHRHCSTALAENGLRIKKHFVVIRS